MSQFSSFRLSARLIRTPSAITSESIGDHFPQHQPALSILSEAKWRQCGRPVEEKFAKERCD
ncbi:MULTISPECIES: hypothetical protein [Mesorhizobium]|uniref:Uncharacterized protein n=1 Tax=Mesorhizobium huakuii TaxID=28104 RepID=A0ABZ0VKD5_9HYPH|nr:MULTISPECIES: hypothetical protein [Mesorhizobium]MBZ9910416.1 hypothetical protein [Mesorhizobium sp. BR115XR7A]WQB96925.1 hypothetical protein U0R22_001008 [Mesorhizobium huakuii]